MWFENLLRDRYSIKCEDSLTQYLELVAIRTGTPYSDEASEGHHILPSCDFKEYRYKNINIVKLSFTEHVEAHRLLWKLSGERNMAYAFHLISQRGGVAGAEAREANRLAGTGDQNPAKLPEVRKKISLSKLGLPRDDMKGKAFFGSSAETVKSIKRKSSEVHSGMVMVMTEDGIRKVPRSDPRIASGELKAWMPDLSGDANPMKRPEAVAAFSKAIEARRERYSKMSGDEICRDILAKHLTGAKTMHKDGVRFSSNFVKLFNYANLNPQDWFATYLQMVEGSTTIETTAQAGRE